MFSVDGYLLARRNAVRLRRVRAEAEHAVVHQHAGAGDDDAAAPGGEDALDVTDDCVFVRDDERRRIAASGHRRTTRAGHIDLRGARGGVLLRQQTLDWHVDNERIGEQLACVLEREPDRLGHDVDGVGAGEAPVADRELLDDVERHENDQALRRRRLLVDRVVAVRGRRWLVPVRLRRGEVVFVEQAAFGAHRVGERATDAAGVEAVAAVRCAIVASVCASCG